MNKRRAFLKGLTLGSGSTLLSPMLSNLAAGKNVGLVINFGSSKLEWQRIVL